MFCIGPKGVPKVRFSFLMLCLKIKKNQTNFLTFFFVIAHIHLVRLPLPQWLSWM